MADSDPGHRQRLIQTVLVVLAVIVGLCLVGVVLVFALASVTPGATAPGVLV